jgi:hypothetical protein
VTACPQPAVGLIVEGGWLVTSCEHELLCTQLGCVETAESQAEFMRRADVERERLNQLAVRQRLSLESGCPVDSIRIEDRTRLERGAESAYRLFACEHRYVCASSPRGIECKSALKDIEAPLTPPPPPSN